VNPRPATPAAIVKEVTLAVRVMICDWVVPEVNAGVAEKVTTPSPAIMFDPTFVEVALTVVAWTVERVVDPIGPGEAINVAKLHRIGAIKEPVGCSHSR